MEPEPMKHILLVSSITCVKNFNGYISRTAAKKRRFAPALCQHDRIHKPALDVHPPWQPMQRLPSPRAWQHTPRIAGVQQQEGPVRAQSRGRC
eukprot:scaffold535_cov260-Pinguiococcus_pyrenoidosus.AAC.4